MSTCTFCKKEFSRTDNARRHETKCKTKTFLQDNNLLELIKDLILKQAKLEEKNMLLQEEVKCLKSQLATTSSDNSNNNIINNTVNSNNTNNYHLTFNINLSDTPLPFGHENLSHITHQVVERLVNRYSFPKVLSTLVQRTYNNPKFPKNQNVKLCPCNDLCNVVAVYLDSSWLSMPIDDIAKKIISKLNDHCCLFHDVIGSGNKIESFVDSFLVDSENNKAFTPIIEGLHSSSLVL